MMKKPNYESAPVIIGGRRCYHIGKDKDKKEVYQFEGGFLKLKNGKTEFGTKIDDEGNFIEEVPEQPAEKNPEQLAEVPKKPGKKK